MDQCTENYECIVIHNNAKSNKLEDQVFWYKASDHEEFRVGAAEYWEYHTRNNDEQDEEEHYQNLTHEIHVLGENRVNIQILTEFR